MPPSSGSGRSYWPSAWCESWPIIQPRPHAEEHRQQALHEEAEQRVLAALLALRGGLSGSRCRRASECAGERFEHGTETVERRRRPVLAVDRLARHREHCRDAGRVTDRALRGAHEALERRGRVAIERRFGSRLTGFGIRGRDHAGDLARDIEVHRPLRLQHAHQLREVEATRERKARSHLGNVAHWASLWTVVRGTVAVTGVSGFSDSGCCRCSTRRRQSTASSASTCAIPRAGPGSSSSTGRHRQRRPRALLEDVDTVVHLAAIVDPIPDEALMTRVNVDGTRRVLDAAAAAGVRKVVRLRARRCTARGRTTRCRSPRTPPAPESRFLPGDPRRRVRAAARRVGDGQPRAASRPACASRRSSAPGASSVLRGRRDGPAAGRAARRGAAGAGRSRRRRRAARCCCAVEQSISPACSTSPPTAGSPPRTPTRCCRAGAARRCRTRLRERVLQRAVGSGLGDVPPAVVPVPRVPVGRRERPAAGRGLEAEPHERGGDPARVARTARQRRCRGSRRSARCRAGRARHVVVAAASPTSARCGSGRACVRRLRCWRATRPTRG